MKSAKYKIKRIVNQYKVIFKDEFADYMAGVKVREKSQLGEIKSTKDSLIRRVLYDIPETLFNLIHNKLEVEEDEWLRSVAGGRWFAKTYKEFSLIEKI